jgi:hypothetical protein
VSKTFGQSKSFGQSKTFGHIAIHNLCFENRPLYMGPKDSTHNTQRSRILQVFLEARGGEVPLHRILDLKISQYGTRILELRRLGFRITNRTERVDGQTHSYFRLVTGPTPTPAPQSQSTPGPASLFDMKGGHRDE